MSSTVKDLEDALRDCLVVLTRVQKNQEYQLKHGYPDFTSASTEIEWKKESQKKTDEMVETAIFKVAMILTRPKST